VEYLRSAVYPMRQTRHKSERVAMTYIRPATVWRNNATDGLSDEEPKK
jgi:hypothetical protein